MPLNHLGVEQFQAPPPHTRPPINLPPLDTKAIEAEAREAQARVRTIRAGRDAWEAINKAQSFDGWKAIGAALSVGKQHALKVSRANAAWGRAYSKEFSLWVRQHGFERMPAPTRSVAVELHQHAAEIEAWRSTLDERTRRRLVHPLSNVRKWKTAVQAKEKAVTDTRRAVAAWARFVAHVEALTPDQALPFWQAAQAQAAAAILWSPLP